MSSVFLFYLLGLGLLWYSLRKAFGPDMRTDKPMEAIMFAMAFLFALLVWPLAVFVLLVMKTFFLKENKDA